MIHIAYALSTLWSVPVTVMLVGTIGLLVLFMGNPILDNLYISTLSKIFAYAARTIRRPYGKSHLKKRKRSHEVPSRRTKLIKRDILLTEANMHLNPEIMKHADRNMLEMPSYFVKCGIEAIIEDEVTQRFSSEELEVWNLLSRTHRYQHINIKLTILWIIGFLIRYCVLFPIRLIIFTSAITICVTTCWLIGFIPVVRLRRQMNRYNLQLCFRLFTRAFSAVITFHNQEHRPKSDGICVANHTSPLDVIILGCDNAYAMVGQRHDGFLGLMESAFSRCESHIWFNRGEMRDRLFVLQKMKEHVEDRDKLPILVFPEGTCINNTSVMMFKKGSFEAGAVIYPIAIKYDPRFADCFWNSSKYSMLQYLFMMMTSWAIKTEIWYLPPQKQHPDESGIEFANRVKQKIAIAGGLVDLDWDGMLKRSKPKENCRLAQQENFAKNLLSGDSRS